MNGGKPSFPAGENVVEVEVKNLTPDQETELRRRYPDIKVSPGEYPEPSDRRTNSAGQWKGGLLLNRNIGGTCTANFTWVSNVNSNIRYIGTAGHCNGAANFRGTGTRFFHNANLGSQNPSMVGNSLVTNPSTADAGMLQWPSRNPVMRAT